MDCVIRPYTSSDPERCRALWVELTQRHRDLYDDKTIGGEDPGSAFDRYLTHEGLHGPWVAEMAGEVIGLTGLLVHGTEAEVEPVVVAMGHRGRGIGRKLVEHARAEARKLGVVTLGVRPVARNVEAITLFVSLGFDTVGQIDLIQDLSPREGRIGKGSLRLHEHDLKY